MGLVNKIISRNKITKRIAINFIQKTRFLGLKKKKIEVESNNKKSDDRSRSESDAFFSLGCLRFFFTRNCFFERIFGRRVSRGIEQNY